MAPKLLRCLLQICFDDQPDADAETVDSSASVSPQQNRITRLLEPSLVPQNLSLSSTTAGTYHLAAVQEPSPVRENVTVEDGVICCETTNLNISTTTTSSTSTSTSTSSAAAPVTITKMSGIREFFKSVQERLNLTAPTETTTTTSTTTSTSVTECQEEYVPILTEASSFDSSKEVPTISTDHIVLPGSNLQLEMAKAMVAKLGPDYSSAGDDDECVICMEGFDPTNPRMPTLCGCGENKTYFHLPCLYQWVEQSGRRCPSCRKRLQWEEF